jgi:hypothetical protein
MLIIAATNTYSAYQQPTTTEETIPITTYTHNTKYDYTIYLFPNTIYNKTILKPGEGTLFEKLIDHIDISFTHYFNTNTATTISGYYTLDLALQTSIWTKSYQIIPQTKFNTTGASHAFTINTPLDIDIYDQILTTINSETGITAANPTLVFICNINLIAQTPHGPIFSTISPKMDIAFGGRILEITDALTDYKSGTLTDQKTIYLPEVEEQRTLWGSITGILSICLIFMLLFTRSTLDLITEKEKKLKHIYKKYGEWIVEAQTNPSPHNTSIPLTSIQDLSKISEDLGKPILHYTYGKEEKEQHTFYIIDDTTLYKYHLDSESII